MPTSALELHEEAAAEYEAAFDWYLARSILEIVADHRGDTYRAVYTARFEHAVYVLHAFQKKSPKGRKTPQSDVELISRRLKMASEDHETRYGKRSK